MRGPERVLHARIAWLKATIAAMRVAPVWPFWWPMLYLLESELALLDRAAQTRQTLVEQRAAPVIDLAQWRRRGAAARA